MSLDLDKDARRLRAGLLASAVALIATLVFVAGSSMSPEWHGVQERFRQLGLVDRARVLGIMQVETCTADLDRCTTCHLGVLRKDLAGKETPLPFRTHAESMAHHLENRVGCSVCHGGTGRALESKVAHASPGTTRPDPLLGQPHIQASCARCHVPGDQPGMERLVDGIELYLGLGCAICHPLSRGGRGGWDFGPDLRSIGRKSIDYLKASLVDPAANFPQSTMPSFEVSFRDEPEAMENVLIFLQSLVLERAEPGCGRLDRSLTQVEGPCASCHSGAGGVASGRFRHRCTYLIERGQQLKCAGCHKEAVPAPGISKGRCPAVTEHRPGCVACHDLRAKRGTK